LEIAPPEKQARIEADAGASQEGLGLRCDTFSGSDEQKTIVAFWQAKPWDAKATPANGAIALPLTREPRHVFLYDFLSGKQTEVPWKRLDDNRISISVSITAAPKLVIARL
jgi:hypothetical protein